ncbi:AAA family ATPase, partial [Pseudomonas aeruginosa]
MKLIINKVALRNFKAFRFQVFNIGSKNLTVLDGPNGFGKTSFFDALELLLTGDISRYRNLEATMDKRSVAFGSPIVYEDADDGAEISISAEIETSSGIVFLRRSVRKNDLDKDRGLGFS